MTCSPPARSWRSGSASDDVARALRADGLATTLGGILNSFPYTCFAENVGLVRLTRVKSRYVVAAAGVDHDPDRPGAQGGRDRRRHPAPGARRRRAGDVRHRRGRRLPDPVPGRLPRPPQRRDRRDQRRPGDVRHRAAARRPGGAGLGRRSSSAAASRWAASPRSCSTSCSTTSARAAARPSPARPGDTRPPGPGQRDDAGRSSSRTFAGLFQGPRLGGRAGLRAAAVLRHPRPAPRPSRRRCSPPPPRSRRS